MYMQSCIWCTAPCVPCELLPTYVNVQHTHVCCACMHMQSMWLGDVFGLPFEVFKSALKKILLLWPWQSLTMSMTMTMAVIDTVYCSKWPLDILHRHEAEEKTMPCLWAEYVHMCQTNLMKYNSREHVNAWQSWGSSALSRHHFDWEMEAFMLADMARAIWQNVSVFEDYNTTESSVESIKVMPLPPARIRACVSHCLLTCAYWCQTRRWPYICTHAWLLPHIHT